MSEWHPTDAELARLSDDKGAGRACSHIRSCVRCRSAAAEYEWLQTELAETLKMVANQVSLPPAAWWEIHDRVRVGKHRQMVRLRASAVTSAMLVLCLLLCVPILIKPAVAAQTLQPEVSLRPTPIAITEPAGAVHGSRLSRASATHAAGDTTPHLSIAPTMVPLPTPPDSGL